jgi:serine phosphatase RsbU (regulator of sigma subunit)
MSEEQKAEIEFAGVKLGGSKLLLILPLLSALGGALWGGFEFYKDYMDMKEKITTYVTPDMSGFQEQLSVIKKDQEGVKKSVDESNTYTADIKNDLKGDIRRLEAVVDSVERQAKQSARDADQDIKINNKNVESKLQKMSDDQEKIKKEVDSKIQKALDNPLNH